MENAPVKYVINQTLLIWCGVIIVELFVIAHLMSSALILLFGLVVIPPARAAWNWPLDEGAPEGGPDTAAPADSTDPADSAPR